MIFQDILINGSILILAGYLYGSNLRYLTKAPLRQYIFTGIVFGLISILSMIFSFELRSGLIFDGRSVILGLSGVFGGTVAAAISIILASIYRIIIGGEGLFTGLLVICVTGASGALFHFLAKQNKLKLNLLSVYVFGLILHLLTLILFLTLPTGGARMVITMVWKPFIIVFPVVTAFLYFIIADQRKRFNERIALSRSEEQLQFIFDYAPDGLMVIREGLVDQVNKNMLKILGIENKQDAIGKSPLTWIHPDDAELANQRERVLSEGDVVLPIIAYRLLSGDGTIVHVEVQSTDLQDSIGKLTLAVARDVTERNKTKEFLLASEKKFKALVEQSITGIYIFEKDRFLYVNSKFCEIFGYSEEEILTSLKPTDVVMPEERSRANENIDKRLQAQVDSVHYIAQGKSKSNKELWIEIHGTHIKLDGKDVITGTVLDITDRWKVQRELEKSEIQFRTAFEQSASGMCITSLTGNLLMVNQNLCEILGFQKEELEGTNFNDITHIEDKEIGKEFVKNMLQGGSKRGSFEKRYLHKNGEIVWVRINSALVRDSIGEPVHFITQIEDITHIKASRVALAESEERLRLATEQAHVAVWEYDYIINSMSRSSNHDGLYGLEVQEKWDINTFLNATHPDDREYSAQIIQDSRAAGGPDKYNFDFRVIYSDRSVHWLMVNGEVVKRNEQGEGILVRGTLIDITDRKVSENRTALSEKRYRELFENMNTGFVLFELVEDDKGKPVDLIIITANHEFELTTGLVLKEVLGKRLTHVIPGIENDSADWIGTYGKIAKFGESRQFEGASEILGYFYSVNAFQSGPNRCAVTFLNITERKNAEEEIRKLNTDLENRVKERTVQLDNLNKELQDFTYSVSHDLKAPLRGISGYSRLLSDNYSSRLDGEGLRFLGNIRSGTEQMNQLIDDLLSYSRLERTSIRLTDVDVKKLINDIIDNYKDEIEERDVKLNVDVDSSTVRADFKGLTIAVRNLLENAIKFTRNKESPVIQITLNQTETEWTISVKDNGVGFEMQFHDKIFDIFQRLYRAEDFEGTGIGLALVKKVIQRMGGSVRADSKIGKGATFYLHLPKTRNNES